jgi:Nitrile hydratase, alpha chain
MLGEQSRAEQGPRARQAMEAELAGRAGRDAAFRRALAADPTGTLERELGVRLPEGVSLTVLEETPTSRYLVLPPRPAGGGGELSDEELDGVSGGTIWTGSNLGCIFD